MGPFCEAVYLKTSAPYELCSIFNPQVTSNCSDIVSQPDLTLVEKRSISFKQPILIIEKQPYRGFTCTANITNYKEAHHL